MSRVGGAPTARGELLTGWGRAAASAAFVVRPTTMSELEACLAGPGARLARGLGRSYGDAAQCAGGTVVDITALDRVVDLDEVNGMIRAEAGCSLEKLMTVALSRGFFVPVTPGTRKVTLGGAIASDIHGKNHHHDGTIGAHVEGLRLLSPSGTFECSAKHEPDAFFATTGGMGLTGIVSEATLSLLRVETSRMIVDTERLGDLEACMAALRRADLDHRYSVAWIDCLATGRHLGRSVLTAGNHARVSDLKGKARRDPLGFEPRQRLTVPAVPPVSLVNLATVTAFNEAWYRKAPIRRSGEVQSIPAFFHPLDGVARWNVLYGPRGFTQYQFVVPFGAEKVLETVLGRLSEARVASSLAVLKCFGAQGQGHLSFPSPGWTLALDLPLGSAGLPELLDGLDELVTSVGGRVYLAKDGRVRPAVLRAMYPRLAEWNEVRRRLDAHGVLSSDLSRRLHLATAA